MTRQVPKGLALDSLMRKMALDKKNRGNTIKCTIVTDIGVSIVQPQPVIVTSVTFITSVVCVAPTGVERVEVGANERTTVSVRR